jgi:NitT/TauT family transport system substrate-binding protein
MRLVAFALALIVAVAARAEQISVTHWGVLMYGTPYAVAMEKGFFKEAGINIDGILTSKGGGTTVRNVLAGGLPYGEVSLAAAISASQQGIDIKIVNGAVRNVADVLWVTMPDSPIKTMQDLKGKKVAFTSPKSVTEMLLLMLLDSQGMKPGDVERVSTGAIGAGLTALSQGGVAAAPILDPIWSREKDKYRPVIFVKDALPPMMQTVGITTPEFAKSNPAKLKAIIAGRTKGVEFIYQNPKEAGAIFAKAYNLAPNIAETAVQNMVDIKYWAEGRIELKAMDDMLKGLRLTGEIEGPVDWKKLVDESFLPASLKGAS